MQLKFVCKGTDGSYFFSITECLTYTDNLSLVLKKGTVFSENFNFPSFNLYAIFWISFWNFYLPLFTLLCVCLMGSLNSSPLTFLLPTIAGRLMFFRSGCSFYFVVSDLCTSLCSVLHIVYNIQSQGHLDSWDTIAKQSYLIRIPMKQTTWKGKYRSTKITN